MKDLIQGLRDFKDNYFCSHFELFEQLTHGQTPKVLFITCSDSRIDPNLITQAQPGDLFVIRNAGNIIPPYGAANGGEGAAIEYAINALDIEQVIICGHSHCGAIKGLLKLESLEADMPLVHGWLRHAEATRLLIKEHYSTYEGEELIEAAIAENVLTQLENLKTYPVIHSRLYQGKLKLYGWIYNIETGEVLSYNVDNHSFLPVQHTAVPTEAGTQLPRIQISKSPVSCPIPETVAFPLSWLSPEQEDRIYRGSATAQS